MSHPRYRYGMNWIRQEKRLAIYMRDDFACVYCGAGVEDEITLTLDHVRHYGDNEATNLVTACMGCNVEKGRRRLEKFAPNKVTRVKAALGVSIESFLAPAKKVLAARKVKTGGPF